MIWNLIRSVVVAVLIIAFVMVGFRNEKETDKRFEVLLRRIHTLNAGITLEGERAAFILKARDLIRKTNKSLGESEAYYIAKCTFDFSKAHKVDPLLLLAVQAQESRFKKEAVGQHGEIGVCQILPTTGRFIFSCFDWQYDQEELSDLSTNIECGAIYLNFLGADFKTIDLQIAAYNGGPKNIMRGKIRDMTKIHVERVKKFYRSYSATIRG
jgi:soluble lytic murein transglycosylase